jgi:hypothetical protein
LGGFFYLTTEPFLVGVDVQRLLKYLPHVPTDTVMKIERPERSSVDYYVIVIRLPIPPEEPKPQIRANTENRFGVVDAASGAFAHLYFKVGDATFVASVVGVIEIGSMEDMFHRFPDVVDVCIFRYVGQLDLHGG